MAFISSFTPSLHFGSKPKIQREIKYETRMAMQKKSPAMPFLEAPSSLSSDIPGYVGFDPLKFSNYVDVNFLREAEIKHGRICMLAIVGFMVAELYTFPFYAEAPHVVVMRHEWGVKQGSLKQILLWCSFFEALTFPAFYGMWTGESDREPGDFSFDPLGLGKDPAKKFRYQVNEIKNGRLAMVAVGGAVHHALLTNQNMFEQISNGAFFLK